MSERKVLNKYYPPDFDPSKIPRLRLPKNRQYTVRIMAPCNMRCNTCGDYIARGKKFNARKETVENEEYLGLKVFRFYFKCPRCMQEITFKTDPKNYDYIVEHGATPNFKALKFAQQQAIEEQKEKEEEERLNPMKLLENRTKASRREMENLEALEDLKEMNQREVVIDYEELLRKKKEEFEAELRRQEEEDEKFVQSIFSKQINEDENDEELEEIVEEVDDMPNINMQTKLNSTTSSVSNETCTNILNSSSNGSASTSKETNKRKLLQDLVVVKRKASSQPSSSSKNTENDNSNKPSVVPSKPTNSALSSLCTYSDSESD